MVERAVRLPERPDPWSDARVLGAQAGVARDAIARRDRALGYDPLAAEPAAYRRRRRGTRFRYRLVGTALVAAFGREYTGKWLDELFTTQRSKFAEEVYRFVCSERLPIFARSTYVTVTERQLIANRLCMPLSADGATVTMIMGALTFESSVRPVAGAWGQARMLDARWTEVIKPAELSAEALACANAAQAEARIG